MGLRNLETFHIPKLLPVGGTIFFHHWRNVIIMVCFLRFILSFLTDEDETT
jgi:hypothetical protein